MLGGLYPLHRIATFALMLVAAGWLVRLGVERDSSELGATRTDGFVVRSSRTLMGTAFHVSVWAPAGRQPEAADAIQRALDRAALLERAISSWDIDSETSALNRAAGLEAIHVGRDLSELLKTSLAWSRRTDGAFDITVGPLVELWKQARRDRVLPSQREIDQRLAICGFNNIDLGARKVRLRTPSMQINFGAIGKGFAADRVAETLQENGFYDFIIDAGGDILVHGSRGSTPWRVAIRDPRRRGHLAVCNSGDRAIATSGDYEQFAVIDGVRYSHIIDPRTGKPARGIASVTVFTRRGVDADALATALFVMETNPALEFVEGLKDTEAFMVLEDGTTRCSSGLDFNNGQLSITSTG